MSVVWAWVLSVGVSVSVVSEGHMQPQERGVNYQKCPKLVITYYLMCLCSCTGVDMNMDEGLRACWGKRVVQSRGGGGKRTKRTLLAFKMRRLATREGKGEEWGRRRESHDGESVIQAREREGEWDEWGCEGDWWEWKETRWGWARVRKMGDWGKGIRRQKIDEVEGEDIRWGCWGKGEGAGVRVCVHWR